jgi:hypothetical protein
VEGSGIGGPGGPRTQGVTRPRLGKPGRHRDGAWPGRRQGPRPDLGAPAGDRVRGPRGRCPIRAPVGRGSRSRRVERLGRRGAWPGEAGTGERADAGAALRAHAWGGAGHRRLGRRARLASGDRGPGDGWLRGGLQAIIHTGHWVMCRRRRGLAPRPRPAGRTVARGASAATQAALGGRPNRLGARQLVRVPMPNQRIDSERGVNPPDASMRRCIGRAGRPTRRRCWPVGKRIGCAGGVDGTSLPG